MATEALTMSDNVVARTREFFSVPAPIKRIFDRFPLTTYPPNDLPERTGTNAQGNRLFIFTDATNARRGRPSFNPQCLKWQVSAVPLFIYRQNRKELINNLINVTGISEIRRH